MITSSQPSVRRQLTYYVRGGGLNQNFFRLAVIWLLLCLEWRKIMILPNGNYFQVRHWHIFDFGIYLKMKILTSSNLVFSGTKNSNIAFIFSLDAVLFYKNLCLDNRIYFRALNSYIKTRMSWEKTNAIFEFLVTKSFEKNFCHKFHVHISGCQNFNFQINFKIESTLVSNLKVISNR